MKVMVQIEQQSAEINQAVSHGQREMTEEEKVKEHLDNLGAGDQGIMFGYATDETPELFPLTLSLSHKILEEFARMRKANEVDWLRPDAKSQVTIEYKDDNGSLKPIRIHTVLVSHQHAEGKTNEDMAILIKEVCLKVLPTNLVDDRIKWVINPSGSFTIGGPHGDAGLTGRKIIVDT